MTATVVGPILPGALLHRREQDPIPGWVAAISVALFVAVLLYRGFGVG